MTTNKKNKSDCQHDALQMGMDMLTSVNNYNRRKRIHKRLLELKQMSDIRPRGNEPLSDRITPAPYAYVPDKFVIRKTGTKSIVDSSRLSAEERTGRHDIDLERLYTNKIVNPETERRYGEQQYRDLFSEFRSKAISARRTRPSKRQQFSPADYIGPSYDPEVVPIRKKQLFK